MQQVEQLRADWERESAAKKAAAEKRKAKRGQGAPDVEEESGLFDDQLPASENAPLFEDSDDDDEDANDNNAGVDTKLGAPTSEVANDPGGESAPADGALEKELFGDSSSDESDDELVPTGMKRPGETQPDEDNATKRRRVMDDDDDE